MRGTWRPPRHSAPLVHGVLAQSTEDAPTRGISSRGRLVVMAPGGDVGTATAPSLARCLTPAKPRGHLIPGPAGRRSSRASLLLRLRRRAPVPPGGSPTPHPEPAGPSGRVSSDAADANLDVNDRKTVILIPRHGGHSSWRQ